MPKKRTKTPPKADLTAKLIKFPQDWIERIDAVRGDVSFSDYVRAAVLTRLGRSRDGLSDFPGWGGKRTNESG